MQKEKKEKEKNPTITTVKAKEENVGAERNACIYNVGAYFCTCECSVKIFLCQYICFFNVMATAALILQS
jgi:hypothetical protein